jgi:hypothetical protein
MSSWLSITPGRAANDERLSDGEYRTLARICWHTNTEHPECFPKQSTVAESRGLSRETINRHIKKLRVCEYLIVDHQHDPKTGAQMNNEMEVLYGTKEQYRKILDKLESGKNGNPLYADVTPPVTPNVTPPMTLHVTPPVTPDVTHNDPVKDPIKDPLLAAKNAASVSEGKELTFGEIDQLSQEDQEAYFNGTYGQEEAVPEPTYADTPWEDDDASWGRKRPKWQEPKDELVKRALRACGRKFYENKVQRNRWLTITKSMLPLKDGLPCEYPTDWVIAMIEWAEKKNGNHKDRHTRARAGVVNFKGLISAIENKGHMNEWLIQYEQKRSSK